MSTTYSRFPEDKTSWQLFTQICKKQKMKVSEESFLKYLSWAYAENQKDNLRRGWTAGSVEASSRDFLDRLHNYCEFLMHFRPMQHYFLAPGVSEFCIGAVKETSPDFYKALPQTPEIQPIGSTDKKTGTELLPGLRHAGFLLHFPVKERRTSLMVLPEVQIEMSDDLPNQFHFIATDGHQFLFLRHGDKNPLYEGEQLRDVKLLYGVSLYMDAFPDAVVPAIPTDILQAYDYKGARISVRPTSVMQSEEHSARSPHWRRGHFRMLNSSRFIHKQGQTIYIKGMFVKGSAFEVLDDAPPTKETT